MRGRYNELLVGILTLTAIAILVTGMLWLKNVDLSGGEKLYQVDFGVVEGLRKGEKPIRTDIAVHVTPVSIVIHTPINFLFKKDLLEAGTYLDNQVVNGYVARVRELQRQGMFY